jgi:cytochrome c oxidase subunit IV
MSHISPKSTYYTIFASLMVLTIVTVAVAFVDLGLLSFPVALGIAIVKATLVILFFMHVKYSSQLTKLFVVSTFFFLVVLFGLTMTDYLTRGWRTYEAGAGGAGFGWRVQTPPEPQQER